MMRVLVTGASGFVGSRCLPYLLEAGYEVHACGRMPHKNTNALWHSVDLLSPGASARLIVEVEPDAVLHLAWCTAPGEYWSSPDNVRWVQASTELIYASSEAGCRRFIGAGTSAEYDWNSGRCSEQITPLRPESLYGVCKCAVFSVLQTFAPLSGMTWAWGRIFNVYGPEEDPRRLVPTILRAILNETESGVPVADQIRDFLYVDDVARALVTLMDGSFCGAVNIASGQAVPIKTMVDEIALILGKTADVRNSISPGQRIVQATTEILTRNIGWQARYSLSGGLRETVNWWRAQL